MPTSAKLRYLFQKIRNNDDTDASLEEYASEIYQVYKNEEHTSFTIGRKRCEKMKIC